MASALACDRMERPVDGFGLVDLEELIRRGLTPVEAEDLGRGWAEAPTSGDQRDRWAYVSRSCLTPKHPVSVHEYLFQQIYRNWDASKGPPPAWIPPEDIRRRSNLGRFLDGAGFGAECDFRDWALANRAGFWAAMTRALKIKFARPPTSAFEAGLEPGRTCWFPGSLLNIAESCFQSPPEAIAVRQFPEGGGSREVTYGELEGLSGRVAGGLASAGVSSGEAVGILLPMTIEAVASLLGIIRAGCVAVLVAESFAPPEVEQRLRLGGAQARDHAGGHRPPWDEARARLQIGRMPRPGRRHSRRGRGTLNAAPRRRLLGGVPGTRRRIRDGSPRVVFSRDDPLLLGDDGGTQGDPLVTDHPDQGRGRWVFLSGHRAGGRRGMAHEPRLDDGALAGFRDAH